ncbi:MAG TPA: winged helix-turn-helix domain-containing protein [Chloroflexi bacterium]|nr:winged helix-turn-helix domain-containing protein [Chloroflexota bacterium]
MAFWQKKVDEYSDMVELIEQQPGITARELARQLDVSPSTITRRLPSLDEAGILLAEDDKGGLWPFGKRK